jgi:type IV secretion system protein VirD4
MAGYGIRAYLIAQSLNQISQAYGENNSILDNCHVRIAFSTNDERTAKRISDALGTSTEQRAQRNYAGHRLAPWLSHVMVSRQETARPLLTPGEVMQLPANDQLVLVSGLPPIRAKKLRYYEDRNFRDRIFPAPILGEGGYPDCPPARPNDWNDEVRGLDDRLKVQESADNAASGDEDEGGLQQQRQPGVPEESVTRPERTAEVPKSLFDDEESNLGSDPSDLARRRIASARALNDRDHRRLDGDDPVPAF